MSDFSDQHAKINTGILTCGEDITIHCFQYLYMNEVQIVAMSCKGFRDICTSDGLWYCYCATHWATKQSKYHLTNSERRNYIHRTYPGCSWYEIYHNEEDDGSRQYFKCDEELSELTFDYRYRCEPDKSMSLNFKFNPNHHVSGHPNHLTYEWKLLDRGRSVTLGLFPPARVRRLKSWGWALKNPNIVCVSLDEGVQHQAETLVSDHPEFFNPEDRVRGPSAAVRALLASLREEGNEVAERTHGGEPSNHTAGVMDTQSASSSNHSGGSGSDGRITRERTADEVDSIFQASAGIFYGVLEANDEL